MSIKFEWEAPLEGQQELDSWKDVAAPQATQQQDLSTQSEVGSSEPSFWKSHQLARNTIEAMVAAGVVLGVYAGYYFSREQNPQEQKQVQLVKRGEQGIAQIEPKSDHYEITSGARRPQNFNGWITHYSEDSLTITNNLYDLNIKVGIPNKQSVGIEVANAIRAFIEAYPNKEAFRDTFIEVAFGRGGEPVFIKPSWSYSPKANASVYGVGIASTESNPTIRDVLCQVVSGLGFVDRLISKPGTGSNAESRVFEAIFAAINGVGYDDYAQGKLIPITRGQYNLFRNLPDLSESTAIKVFSTDFVEEFASDADESDFQKIEEVLGNIDPNTALIYTVDTAIGPLQIVGDISADGARRIIETDKELFQDPTNTAFPYSLLDSTNEGMRRVVVVNDKGVTVMTKIELTEIIGKGHIFIINGVDVKNGSIRDLVGDEMFPIIYGQAVVAGGNAFAPRR